MLTHVFKDFLTLYYKLALRKEDIVVFAQTYLNQNQGK